MYLFVSYFNTERLASHFEPDWFISNLWALAVEVGDVTLLIGTLRRKRQGKTYAGYFVTFLISLAVSVAANVAEASNYFLGNDAVYNALHEFIYPWIVPALLGVTIPALMLATGSMLSDFDNSRTSDKPYDSFTGNGLVLNGQVENSHETDMAPNGDPETISEPTPAPATQDRVPVSVAAETTNNEVTKPSPQELATMSVEELCKTFSVSRRTAYRWKSDLRQDVNF